MGQDMLSNRISQGFEKIIGIVCNILRYVGVGMLFVMMILGAADVIGRYLLNSPIPGVMEISEILLAGIVFFGWAYTQATRGHITVDLFFSRIPHRGQTMFQLIHSIVGLILFALIAWQATRKAVVYWKVNMLVDVIRVPMAPFQMFVSVGAFFLCLVFIAQILQSLSEMRKEG